MERSSRVLQHGNPKIWFFFQKSSRLNFDLCQRAEINIQLGLNHGGRILWKRCIIYASPSSGEAYRDRRLTTNFELGVEIFCVPTCFHKRIPKPCLSVCPSVCPSVCLSICPYPEKRNHHSFVNISPTLVIDTSMERSSRVLRHGNPKIEFFFQKSSKFEFWLLTKSWNHLSFVNISPTLVIDTSMERSSRVVQHGNPKIWFFFKKVQN